MTRAKSISPDKNADITLSDADMITKRIYGRRTILRGFGAALLGVGATAPTAAIAGCDSDKRELGDKGKDRFADSNFRDPKTDCRKNSKKRKAD